MTYDYAEKNPDLIKRMISEGHTVGNHTYSHPSLPDCSPDEMYNELYQLHSYISSEFGYEMYVMRPPMGEFSERVLACARGLGYTTVLWSFAYEDWNPDKQPDQSAAFETALYTCFTRFPKPIQGCSEKLSTIGMKTVML